MAKIVIVVVLAYVAGVILSFVQGAHWAFYLYQLVYFLNPENRWWSNSLPDFAYSKITVLVLMLTYVIYRKKYIINNFSHNILFKWLFLLLVIYGITYFYAVDQLLHKQALIDFFKMIVVISIAYKILDTKKKLEFAVLVYIVGSAYIGYEAFITGRNSMGRVEGIGLVDAPEANGTAAAIVSTVPFLIYFFWWGNKKIKVAMMIFGPVIINGLILINSRGSFLGAVAGASIFMWMMMFSKFRAKNQRLVAIGLIIVGLSGVFSLVDESFIDRMTGMTKVQEGEKIDGSQRTIYWLATFDMLKDYPLGVGAEGYKILSRNYLPEEVFAPGQTQKSVHSIWFQALSEIGWHGFFIFIVLLIISFQLLNRVKQKCVDSNDLSTYYFTQALFCAFVGLLITSTFISQFRVQIVYWFILFIACLHSIVVVNDSEKK